MKPLRPPDSLLTAVPAELSRALFAKARSASLPADQTLFVAGESGDGCYRIEEGLLKASVVAAEGSERILAILGPGSIVGEISMIDGGPRSASVTALRDSKLSFVSRADFEASNWAAVFLPKGTPAAIVQKLHDAVVEAANTPAVQKRLKDNGVDLVAPERRSPDYLATFVASEIAKWAGPIKASGVTSD